MATKILVEVWGKQYEIIVDQKPKTVWIAVGDYMGERLETRGKSERDAVGRWSEAVRNEGERGNLNWLVSAVTLP